MSSLYTDSEYSELPGTLSGTKIVEPQMAESSFATRRFRSSMAALALPPASFFSFIGLFKRFPEVKDDLRLFHEIVSSLCSNDSNPFKVLFGRID